MFFYVFKMAVAIASHCVTLWAGFKIFGPEIVWVYIRSDTMKPKLFGIQI